MRGSDGSGVEGPNTAHSIALLEREASLDPTLESARDACRFLRACFQEFGHDDWLDSGELAISEIVTNAALHAHTSIQLRLIAYPDRICVEVRDFNDTLPVSRDYDVEATTGRGMALVAAVALDYGVHSLGAAGKIVWFCIGDPPERAADDLFAAWDLEGWDETPPEAPEEISEVVLASMPATLWLSARQHHDAILRELVLYCAEHDDVNQDLTAADKARSAISSALTDALHEAHARGTARPALPDEHPSPLPWVPEHLDLRVAVPSDSAWQFTALQDALDAAEALAVDGNLLSRPGLPEIIAVRDWACEEVCSQLAGNPPAPWPGTAQERFETEVHDRTAGTFDWDSSAVTDAGRAVIVADDANRIVAVSRPLADLLGWEPGELIGRRVVTVIPPALREAHVAGFSRHLSTGEAHVLGVPLTLPVLRKDGSEVECRFLVERAAIGTGRAAYIARVDPLDGAGPAGEADDG